MIFNQISEILAVGNVVEGQRNKLPIDEKIASRSGIGTDKIDFAIVDNKTNIVKSIYVGYADTSKNLTAAERGYSEHYTVGIGSTYRSIGGRIPNKCLVKRGWKYTPSEGFFDPVDYTKIYTNGMIQSRNMRLAESDWTQLADAPLSSSKKIEWAAYRQALRDLPANTTDINNVHWPTKPS